MLVHVGLVMRASALSVYVLSMPFAVLAMLSWGGFLHMPSPTL